MQAKTAIVISMDHSSFAMVLMAIMSIEPRPGARLARMQSSETRCLVQQNSAVMAAPTNSIQSALSF